MCYLGASCVHSAFWVSVADIIYILDLRQFSANHSSTISCWKDSSTNFSFCCLHFSSFPSETRNGDSAQWYCNLALAASSDFLRLWTSSAWTKSSWHCIAMSNIRSALTALNLALRASCAIIRFWCWPSPSLSVLGKHGFQKTGRAMRSYSHFCDSKTGVPFQISQHFSMTRFVLPSCN
jgi:hypothetical protein